MFEAARLGDPIAHTSALAGFIAGAVLGVALIAAVAFATFTCGFGVALVAGLLAGVGASALLSLGEAIGSSMSSASGAIQSGSPNVLINSKPAAVATVSATACSKHVPTPMVAQGSSTVFINNQGAARKGDKITCGAAISGGSGDVHIGGDTATYLPVDEEIPDWLRTTVDWAFALAGLVGGLAGLVRVAGGLSRAMLPCAAKFIGGFVIGEAVSRYVVAPVVSRAIGGLFGHPVDVTTGRKLLQGEVDFTVDSPLPLKATRFYGSNLQESGCLGRGWVMNWEVRLWAQGEQLMFRGTQGREIGFPRLNPGEISFHPVEQRYLLRTPDGRYVLYDTTETYYDFGSPDFARQPVAWLQRIEDQCGQWIAFERDAGGRAQRIRTSGGTELCLDYEDLHGKHPQRRLTRVAKQVLASDGEHWQALAEYRYNRHAELTEIRNANGEVTRQFAYGSEGAEAGLMIAHRDALGFECRYRWADIDGAPRVVECATSEGERATFSYDIAGRRTQVTDELGRQAQWHYDAHFNVIASTDLDGSRYAIDYNDNDQPTCIHLPGERSIRLDYDEAGRIIAETDPLGRVTRSDYAGGSQRITQRVLPDGRIWQARYDRQGRLLSTQDPLGRTTQFSYGEDLNPNPETYCDVRGNESRMAWNRRGQLLVQIDPTGAMTRYEYGPGGGLKSIQNALGERVSYTRRATGEITQVQLPNGDVEHFHYDAAGNLIEHHNAAGQISRWLRNARGQVQEASDPSERQLRYRYDPQGRLIELLNGNGNAYQFEYDAGDRLIQETRPDGVQRQLRYAAGLGLVAIDTIGMADDGNAQSRPKRSLTFERDAAGRLLKHHSGTAITEYQWDIGDRIQQIQRQPTAAGVALGIAADTLRFDYDNAGRLIAEHGVNGSVEYQLDDLDQIATLKLPFEQALSYQSDALGYITRINAGDSAISHIQRDKLHRETQRSQGALRQLTAYDSLGRKTWQSSGSQNQLLGPGQGQLWRQYRYDATGELREQYDALRGAIHYQYDGAGHLLSQLRLQDGSRETFAYDRAGNLLDDQQQPGGYIQGNRLKVFRDLRFEYDVWGNLATKRSGQRGTQQFSFDDENRLIRVTARKADGSANETHFQYDALGRRIAKYDRRSRHQQTIMQTTTKFVWQGMRMVQEQRENGVSSYVYSPEAAYTPLARLDAAIAKATADAAIQLAQHRTRIYHFHTDLIGAPMELTDQEGELMWAGKYHAWGKVEHGEAALPFSQTHQPLRYPGQYADESTGLHYNTFRYYDPEIGRFINHDPIGLAGGANLYQYAPNSKSWLDPWGWCGTATIRQSFPDAENRFGHFSIEISKGGKQFHTEQVIVDETTTVFKVTDELAVKEATFAIPKPLQAMRYQESVLETDLGPYNVMTNSCVDHVCEVLRSGGVEISTGAKAQFAYLKSLGFF